MSVTRLASQPRHINRETACGCWVVQSLGYQIMVQLTREKDSDEKSFLLLLLASQGTLFL